MIFFNNVLKNKKTAVFLLNMTLMSSAQAMLHEEFDSQQRSFNVNYNEADNRPTAKVKKSLHGDKIINIPRFAVAVEQEGEGLHDFANHNYQLAFEEQTNTDFRSSSNEREYYLSVKKTVEEHLSKYPNLLYGSTGKDIVVFLGNTGAGKSTLINYLSGKELAVGKWNNLILRNPHDPSAMEIDAGGISKTLLPKSIEVNDSLFFDLPGFGDTRGTAINLVNACFIKNIIERAKSVKFIFVAGIGQITDDRGKSFGIFLEKARQLIPNKPIENFSSLIITKSHDVERTDLQQFLLENTNPLPILKSWTDDGKIDQMSLPRNKTIDPTEKNYLLRLIENTGSQKIDNINVGVIYDEKENKIIKKIYLGEVKEILANLIESYINPMMLYNPSKEDLECALFYVKSRFCEKGISAYKDSLLLNFLHPLSPSKYKKYLQKMRDGLPGYQKQVLEQLQRAIEQRTQLDERDNQILQYKEQLYYTTLECDNQLRSRSQQGVEMHSRFQDSELQRMITRQPELSRAFLNFMPPAEQLECIQQVVTYWKGRIARRDDHLDTCGLVTILSMGTASPLTIPAAFYIWVRRLMDEEKLITAELIYREFFNT